MSSKSVLAKGKVGDDVPVAVEDVGVALFANGEHAVVGVDAILVVVEARYKRSEYHKETRKGKKLFH